MGAAIGLTAAVGVQKDLAGGLVAVSLPLGAAAGAAAVGWVRGVDGSYRRAVVGATAGVLPFFVIIGGAALLQDEAQQYVWLFAALVALAVGPAVGATVGYLGGGGRLRRRAGGGRRASAAPGSG